MSRTNYHRAVTDFRAYGAELSAGCGAQRRAEIRREAIACEALMGSLDLPELRTLVDAVMVATASRK